MPSATAFGKGEGVAPPRATKWGCLFYPAPQSCDSPPRGHESGLSLWPMNGGYGTGKAPLGGWHLTGNILPTPFTPHGDGGGTAATPCPLVRMNPLGLPPLRFVCSRLKKNVFHVFLQVGA